MPETLRMDLRGHPAPTPDDGEATKVSIDAAKLRPPRARRCPVCDKAFSGESRFCPFDGDPLIDAPDWNPSADALLGQVVDGRYRVERVVGEGGMGTVYEVRHLTLGRPFAMKILKREVLEDDDLIERFIREAKAAASVGHPNIVAVNDFGELTAEQGPTLRHRRVPYFVMEMLVGATLAETLKTQRAMPAKRVARIFAQCASALAATHAAGVLHRDLKPDNVFLVQASSGDFVKVLDFGVAKIAGAGRLTQVGRVFGTPHYMSPEQARGEAVDERADIYALGVMMYECATGRVPFEAETYMGVLTQHMFAEPDPIEHVAPRDAPVGALGPIVMRCLEKEVERRFSSMVELGEALEAVLRQDPDGDVTLAPRGPSASGRGPRNAPALHLRDAVTLPGEAPIEVDVKTLPRSSGLFAVGAVVALLGASLIAAWLMLTAHQESPPLLAASAASAAAASSGPSNEPPPALSAEPPAPEPSSVAAPAASLPPELPAALQPPARPKPRAPVAQPAPTPTPETPRTGEVVDPWK